MKELILNVKTRQTGKKSALHQMRLKKEVPAVLYSKGRENLFFTLNVEEYEQVKKGHSQHQILSLVVDGGDKPAHKVIVREVQRDPVSKRAIHLDFLGLDDKHKVRVKVPVHFIGEAYGVKTEGGVLQHVLRKVMIEALPTAIPERVDIDISGLHIREAVRVRDLKPEGYAILTPANLVIGTVKGVRTIEEEQAVAAAAAAAAGVVEGAVAVDGAAAPAADGAAPAADKGGAKKDGAAPAADKGGAKKDAAPEKGKK